MILNERHYMCMCVMRKRKSDVGAARCALGNENPTQHPGSGEGWYRMHFNEGR